ncbi:MAG: hypothetical protein IJY04_00870 [Clostridia bacterium]|nr:hypothetical protein [Clostridia bacterium]
MDFLCEHVVPRKKEGLYRFAKTAIISAWIIVPAIIIVICLALVTTLELDFLWISVFFIPLFAWLGFKIGPITAAYGEVSYEYSIVTGEMEFAKIFGDRFRKKWFTVKLADMDTIAPYTGIYADKADNGSYDRIYKAVSSFSAPNIYYGTWQDDDGKSCIVFMEMIPKSLKMARSFNHATVMSNLVVRGETHNEE